MLGKALKEELEISGDTAFKEVYESTLPVNANIVSAYFVYKVKKEKRSNLLLKARICPHGNKGRMYSMSRELMSTAQFDGIKLLLSMVFYFFSTSTAWI